MKKIILFILVMLFIVKAEAKTYYTNYSEYEQVKEKVEETDLVKLKVENRYLIFKENKIEKFYPSYQKINDMTKTNETKIVISPWLDEEPEILLDRNIIKQDLYEYQDLKKIRYIKLTNLINSNSFFDLAELRLYNKSTRINYKFIDEKYNSIKDDDSNSFVSIGKNEEIIIDLGIEVDINDLKMHFSIHINESSDISFTINLLGEENNKIYANRTILSSLNIANGRIASYLIDKDHFNLFEPFYDDVKLSEKYIQPTKFRIVNIVTKYKTEDLYIKYEKIERDYLNDYYMEALDGYKIDETTLKEFYYVKKRDKIEIKDRLIINDYDTKLEDLIISKTTDDIKITSNINYYKNGEYDINFILPYKIIKEKVIVDIKENYIKALQVQNKYLSYLEKENNKLFINNNKLNVEIKEILKSKDEIVNETNEKLLKYKYENERLKERKQNLEEVDTKVNYQKLLVIPVILIFLIMTFILRKKSI